MTANGTTLTAPLTGDEQERLRADIAARGARAVAKAMGLATDAVTMAAAGGHSRAGTNAAIRGAWAKAAA